MKPEVLHNALWVVAFSVLFVWLVSYAANSLVNAEHNPTVYHVKKICPAPGTRSYPSSVGRG